MKNIHPPTDSEAARATALANALRPLLHRLDDDGLAGLISAAEREDDHRRAWAGADAEAERMAAAKRRERNRRREERRRAKR